MLSHRAVPPIMPRNKKGRKMATTPPPHITTALSSTLPAPLSAPALTPVSYSFAPSSPFYPPGNTTIQNLNPVPDHLSHPYVYGAQIWHGIGGRIVADTQLIIDYKREVKENERLRLELRQYVELSERLTANEKKLDEVIADLRRENAELRKKLEEMQRERDAYKGRLERLERAEFEREQEKAKRDRMYITAELVRKLEEAIGYNVFGEDYHEYGYSMKDIQRYNEKRDGSDEDWQQRWLTLKDRLRILETFGSTYQFCSFLKAMKHERNQASHRAFQVPRSIERLTADVVAYCADVQAEQVAAIERTMEPNEREPARRRAAQECQQYQQRSTVMMGMLEQLVGTHPFGT